MSALLAHAHLWHDLPVLDRVFVGACGLFAAWSIWRAVRLTLAPGETEPDHPKYLVLHADAPPGTALSSIDIRVCPAAPGEDPGDNRTEASTR